MDATPEQWRPVIGLEGVYEVSDLGNVRSVDRIIKRSDGDRRRKGRPMLPNVIKGEYRQVHLRQSNRSKMRLVHHLVLEAFVGPRPDGYEACHDDGDPANNALTNLRWDTPSNNTYDRVRHGTHHSARKIRCPQGHEYDYFYQRPDGGINRCCRTCRKAEQRRRYLRNKEKSS